MLPRSRPGCHARRSPHRAVPGRVTAAALLHGHLRRHARRGEARGEAPLSVEDHWMFAVAPANVEDGGEGAKALWTFADAFARRGRVGVRIIKRPPARAPETQGELNVLEQAHAAYDLYLWLSMRHPAAFPEMELAQALRQTCAAIELGLQQSSSLRMEREWDERRKGGDDVGHVDKTRLRECVGEGQG